jgi:hypothetical protein
MTKDEARIILLEAALRQAQHTVRFLHECLSGDGYIYRYPAQTLARLKTWAELVPPHEMCAHSGHHPGCVSCEQRKVDAQQQREALRGKSE